ncbi:MAG: isochorismatase family protein [Rhodospirillales bacterium]|jgi:ureidoacrylate peracid hydrolase|nr:isochorismatase family protein [Rhodospirillales bacterium]
MTDRILTSVEARLAPGHTALLVIDMQNDFCAEGGYVETSIGRDASACRAVAAPIAGLVADARSAGVPVVWVAANYETARLPAGMQAISRQRGITTVCCAPGSWGAALFRLAALPGEAIVEKSCYSGFRGTNLETLLRSMAVRSLVLAGVQTNVCVESTLRDGHSLGFYMVLAEDCVASHMPDLHEATLKNARFLLGDVLTRRDIAGHWGAR